MKSLPRPSLLRAALAAALALAVTVAHSPAAVAEPVLAQRTENVAGMQGVSMRLPGALHLRQGSPEMLSIEAEPKVLERIEVLRRDGMLIIQSKAPGFQTRHPIVLKLTLRTVRELHADSAADLQAGPLQSDRLRISLEGSDELLIARLNVRHLTVRLSGSTRATISAGQAEFQDVELDGSGDYAAAGFTSRQARVKAAGSGSAGVRVTERVDATIEGSGDIEVAGPGQVLSRIDGAGEVIRRP